MSIPAWLLKEFAEAEARYAELPVWARPIVCRQQTPARDAVLKARRAL